MPLSAARIDNAKPRDRNYRLTDGRGLYLEISPRGGKWWRFKYRFNGKEKRIALGTYPEVSLKKARDRREEARSMIADGVDPAANRRALREARAEAAANSFEKIAREWHRLNESKWTSRHADRVLSRLKNEVFPWIGSRPVSEIEAPELLRCLRRIEDRGAVYTAHRVRSLCSQVFRYAIVTSRASRDPAADLIGALKPHKTKHYATITDPRQIGALLRAIDGYHGTFVVRSALKLAPLVFMRPGNLRSARWSEIDFQAAEWRVPVERMKSDRQHIVPLSRQALAILRDLHPKTSGEGDFVFPNRDHRDSCMSENTINGALHRLGYSKEDLTGHGLRHMASTMLHERGWASEAIERQLAHVDKNKTRATYNYAEYLPERREMMQAWADFLDELRDGAAAMRQI
ncbi:MAG TPA: integrase arm-type DNA-binding domain-containing protein [Gammaproteobacteria bacterium]|nr:integrase arm-type DNA-binding domain-containing protein [Gammaproteobacteria bacterium]